MHLPFRKYHASQVLLEALDFRYPVDLVIYYYFKENKALGSKDRAAISEDVYTFIKWRDLLNFIYPEKTLEEKVLLLDNFQPSSYLEDSKIPLSTRLSCPPDLFSAFSNSIGEKEASKLALCCNTQAPVAIRANIHKTDRETLLDKLSDRLDLSLCKHSPVGLQLGKRAALFQFDEFKQGLFEMQDEGSQLLALLLKARPGDLILDFCSGSGGKSLAFAPQTQGKGQIFLHDIRKKALREAKVRFKRAGIQNAQFLLPSSPALNRLKKKCDWVYVDAPCSGTGTLRRNPDMKYRFTQEMLQELVGKQKNIFEKALSFLKPGGKIIYATCSVLKEENIDQVNYFLNTFPLTLVEEVFSSIPQENEMDGFFAAVFQKNDPKNHATH